MPPKRSGKGTVLPAARAWATLSHRVKRIMQQEDDVGKVATASPLVVAKATELFLHEILQAIEKEARAKGTKKLSMHHIKRAVTNTSSLDFLKDLVSSIADPGDGDNGAGGDDGETAPKKRTRGPAKKAGDGSSNGKASSKAKVPKSGSPAVKEEEDNKPRVSIPISSLLGPSGDDDNDNNATKAEEEDENMDTEEVKPAPTAPTVSRKAADDEDEDYDEE